MSPPRKRSLVYLLLLLSLVACPSLGQAVGTNELTTFEALAESWQMSPRDAVVLDPNLMIKTSSSAMWFHTDYAWIDEAQGHPRFSVGWPGRRHVWKAGKLLPIDINVYPILVMTYRAKGVEQPRFWDYHIVLTTKAEVRSPFGSIRVDNPETATALVPDGKLRAFRIDTRQVEMKPGTGLLATNPLTAMAIGTRAGLEGVGSFELVGMRFEATDATRRADYFVDEDSVRLRVIDPEGRPLEGADVTIDAQRINFARSGKTDRFGYVTLAPMGNESGQHLVRVEKDGWVRTDFDDLRVGDDGAVPLVLEKAVVYRGQIVDERGAGIPNVAVRMHPADGGAAVGTGRTMTWVAVATGADGRWQSPPVPASIEAMSLRYTHIDYVSDRYAETKPGHDTDQLIRAYPVSVMRDGLKLHGRITPATGKTLEGAVTELVVEGISQPLPGWVHADGTYGHAVIDPGHGQLIVKVPGHQDTTVDFSGGVGPLRLDVQLVAE